MQIVRHRLGPNAEEPRKLLDHLLEESEGLGVVQIPHVRRKERLATAG